MKIEINGNINFSYNPQKLIQYYAKCKAIMLYSIRTNFEEEGRYSSLTQVLIELY